MPGDEYPWTQEQKEALSVVAGCLHSTLAEVPIARLLQALALPDRSDLASNTQLEFLKEVYGDDYRRALDLFDHLSHLRMATFQLQALKGRVAALTLNPRQLAAVLAGLRIAQECHGQFVTMSHFFTEGIRPHSIEEIDDLAERLNCRSW